MQKKEQCDAGTLPDGLDESGTVTLAALLRASDWNKPVAFRYVEVAPIPEPSTAALGSLGFIALAGFGFQVRLNRVRPPLRRLDS